MFYEIENRDSLTKTALFSISSEEMTKAIDARLRKLQKTVRIQGYRKGKVPFSVIKQRYEGSILEEELASKLNAAWDMLSEEFDFIIYSAPFNIQPIANTEYAFTAKMEFETKPTIDVKAYMGIEIKQPRPITEETMEDLIQQQLRALQERSALLEPIDDRKTIEVGDVVILSTKPANENNLDDKQLTLETYEITIEAESADSDSRLSDTLRGKEWTQEPFVVELKRSEFPAVNDDSTHEHDPDETVRVTCSLISHNRKILAEINDEFAAERGMSTLDNLIEFYRSSLQDEIKETIQQIVDTQLKDYLLEHISIEFPPNFLTNRRDQAYEIFKTEAYSASFGSMTKEEQDDLFDNYLTNDLRQVKLRWIIDSIFTTEGLEFDDSDLTRSLMQEAAAHKISVENFVFQFSSHEGLVDHLSLITRDRKVLDLLHQHGEITYFDAADTTEDADKNTSE